MLVTIGVFGGPGGGGGETLLRSLYDCNCVTATSTLYTLHTLARDKSPVYMSTLQGP